MNEEFHRQVTTEALGDQLSPQELSIVVEANLGQDRVRSWLFTPERHYDGRFFAQAEAYIDAERVRAVEALRRGDRRAGLAALGRLLHTRQDFYSHSNWMQLCTEDTTAWNATDPAICTEPQAHPRLFAGKAPFWIHAIYMIPWIGPLVKRFYLPADLHEAMNLDEPSRGPLFVPSLIAARKHSRLEWERVKRMNEE